MTTGAPPFDVAIVGFGPVGATLAGLLGRRALRVVVLDKDLDVFPLPRAAHIDHEGLRILQEVGCADTLAPTLRENTGMDFLDADGRTLLSFRSRGRAHTGWPGSSFFHQPGFERTIRATVCAQPTVTTRLGSEVTGLAQETDHVVLDTSGGPVRAAWVVGCDGARSTVRKSLGIGLHDLSFDEPWLVVDVELTRPAPHLPLGAIQGCDPARPYTLVPMPEPRFRFEFMLLEGEDAEEMQRPAVVHRLLGRWLGPDDCRIERSAVYAFHGLVAERWRDGRVLLAGDAAHQMPPFLGQGMCSGMRDAANLAWKLDLVHRGRAVEALFDTYQIEREPHVRSIVESAIGFGRVICTTDVATAAARDREMLAARRSDGAPEPAGMPPLGPGPLIGAGGGALSAQPTLASGPEGAGGRLDDLAGARFVVISRQPLGAVIDEAVADVGVLLIDADEHPEVATVLDRLGTDLAVVRPDRYVLGAGNDLTAILSPLRAFLAAPSPSG